MGARAQGMMFCANGEVERVGFLNDKLIRREKLPLQDQERLKCEAKGEVYVAPAPAPSKEPEKPVAVETQDKEEGRESSKGSAHSKKAEEPERADSKEPDRGNSKDAGPPEAVSA